MDIDPVVKGTPTLTIAPEVTPDRHYQELVRRQRAELQDAYIKGVRRLRWDAGRLAAEREARLRQLLLHAAEYSPFWRQRLAGTIWRISPRPTSVAAGADQGRDDGQLRPDRHRSRADARPGPPPRRSAERRRLPRRRVPGHCHVGIHRSPVVPRLRLELVRHLCDARLALDGPPRRGPGCGAGACFSGSPKHESGIFYAFSTFESGGPTSHCFDATLPLEAIVDGLNHARPR